MKLIPFITTCLLALPTSPYAAEPGHQDKLPGYALRIIPDYDITTPEVPARGRYHGNNTVNNTLNLLVEIVLKKAHSRSKRRNLNINTDNHDEGLSYGLGLSYNKVKFKVRFSF